jgi:Lar family restriction alleviation protein
VTAALGREVDALSCPFCGGRAIWGQRYVTLDRDAFFMHCLGCKLCGPEFNSKEEAVAAWNRRAALASPPGAPVCAESYRLLREAALEFVAKVDRGEAFSKRSYAAFRTALSAAGPASPTSPPAREGKEPTKIMDVQDGNGVKHPIYGDAFVSECLSDVFAKMRDLEAAEAARKGHDA